MAVSQDRQLSEQLIQSSATENIKFSFIQQFNRIDLSLIDYYTTNNGERICQEETAQDNVKEIIICNLFNSVETISANCDVDPHI